MPAFAIKPLTILHTSDWHLGRRLYGRMRYEEFEAFLSWLQETISAQKVDVLIVAGDIFDTMTPSNRAQALYYEFLGKVSKLCCEHIVIVAGNHDSPTFLDAPSKVLKFLNVHVIGTACDDLNDEVLVLDAIDGTPHCIIAAVPYLRDRDVRGSHAGESADSKDTNVIKGIRAHYDEVASIAKARQEHLSDAHQRHIPIIATGHLFAAGSKTTEDDGVRDLYVGSLGQISADMFDDGFDFTQATMFVLMLMLVVIVDVMVMFVMSGYLNAQPRWHKFPAPANAQAEGVNIEFCQGFLKHAPWHANI